ncbi:MAG TPA: hypothetical protein VE870_05910 [Bacteroidales bacterium]|nr:hypothetical protein [Bacteroidales bacterium]
MIVVWLMFSPFASAQMRHHGMLQDSAGFGPMPGCMMGKTGPRMMDNSYMGMMHRNMMSNMSGGFHQGMTANMMPMQKYMMMVNMMPAMQQKFSLTDDQVSKLIDMRTDFKKKQVDYQASLAKERMKLSALLKENGSPGDIHEHLQKCSGIRTDMQVAAYETYMNMKGVLNNDQKEQLKGMMMNSRSGNSSMKSW